MRRDSLAILAAIVAICVTATAYVHADLLVEYHSPQGPHWIGTVDTTADTLTITTWVEMSPNIWNPLLPWPAWPAVDTNGNPFDVPASFDGTISSDFAFISSVDAEALAWVDGQVSTESIFMPGWGGMVNSGSRTTQGSNAWFGDLLVLLIATLIGAALLSQRR